MTSKTGTIRNLLAYPVCNVVMFKRTYVRAILRLKRRACCRLHRDSSTELALHISAFFISCYGQRLSGVPLAKQTIAFIITITLHRV